MSRPLSEILHQIKTLHASWQWHEGQAEVLKAIFHDRKKKVFIQCGRKWGKTEICSYIAYRHAIEVPNAAAYYIAPFYKQAKEILWAPKRVQKFCPELLTGKPHESELRLPLVNDGFLKLDGADNIDAGRGLSPSLIIYDEYKDFKKGFHMAMEPNMAARDAVLVVLGTPPEDEREFEEYNQLAEECGRDGLHIIRPTSDNPHISKEWLEATKEKLIARGDENEWIREYEARYIRGGKRTIFPMFDRDKLVHKHEQIIKKIARDMPKLQWYLTADPGTATVFGALLAALNPYTKQWYVLDEIYATEAEHTRVNFIVPLMKDKMAELYPKTDESWNDKWTNTADEAAAWFINESQYNHDLFFQPTQKSMNKKDNGISLIKDLINANLLMVSDRCENFISEMMAYKTDNNGKFVKEDDHLIDCFRYQLAAAHYEFKEMKSPEEIEKEDPRRAYRMEDDFPQFFGSQDDIDLGDLFIGEL